MRVIYSNNLHCQKTFTIKELIVSYIVKITCKRIFARDIYIDIIILLNLILFAVYASIIVYIHSQH